MFKAAPMVTDYREIDASALSTSYLAILNALWGRRNNFPNVLVHNRHVLIYRHTGVGRYPGSTELPELLPTLWTPASAGVTNGQRSLTHYTSPLTPQT